MKVIQKVYKILALCCWKNGNNKSYLNKHISSTFLTHFHCEIELGGSAFMNHLLSKNKEILEDKNELKFYINECMKRMNNVEIFSPLKAFILRMINNLVSSNKSNLQDLQKLIFNKLLESKNQAESLDVRPDRIEK